ncbi:MAG: TRAP transporter large permease subunit, partial [Pseudomonadota bacterium]
AGIMAFGDGPFIILTVVMVAIFVLGFVLDWLEITLILMPIFAPIVAGLDFGNGLAGPELMIWFGILVAVNLQTSFLTPPFGFSLFYLRSAIGDRIATTDIYRGVLPFILLQLLVLALLIVFPGLITGLI